MNDDFISDVTAAIDTANNAPPAPTNVSDIETQESVLNVLEAHEKKPTEKAKPQQEKPVTSDVKTDQQQQTPAKQEQQQKPDDQQQQQQQQQQKPDDKNKKTVPYMDRFLQQDDKNNLVLADGTIIATAGAARTFFEKLKSEARTERDKNRDLSLRTIQLGEKFVELNNAYEELKKDPARENIEKRTGMQGQQLEEAIDLMREYNVNPVGAIKRILTQAQLRGINLKEIGINNGGLDPAAVRSMLEEIVSKQGGQEKSTQTQPSQEAAVQEATRFLEDFPEAAEHTELLAAARRKYPQKSYAELWHALQVFQQQQAEQEEIAQGQQVVTQRKPQQEKQQQPQRRVTSNVTTDFSKQSFSDIAESIKKDFGV